MLSSFDEKTDRQRKTDESFGVILLVFIVFWGKTVKGVDK